MALTAVSLASPPAFADSVDKTVDAFHKICFAHDPDYERTVVLAKTGHWTPLSDDAAVGPVNDGKDLRGWQATDEGLPDGIMVAIRRTSKRRAAKLEVWAGNALTML